MGHHDQLQAYSGNPSQMVSANKDHGNRGLTRGGDSESGTNLISKAQIHEVMRGINVSIHNLNLQQKPTFLFVSEDPDYF